MTPEQPEQAMHAVAALLKAGDGERAERLARRLVADDPDNVRMLQLLGAVLEQRGQLLQAVDVLQRAQQLDARNLPLALLLARLLQQLSRHSEAADMLDLAADLAPSDADLQYRAGLALAALERADRADLRLLQAVNLRPDDVRYRQSYGRFLVGQHRPQQAEDAFRTALRLQPGSVDARVDLASLLERQARFDEAQRLVDACLEMNPGHIEATIVAARLARRAGQEAKARSLLEPLCTEQRRDESIGRVHLELAQVLDQLGEYESARRHCEAGHALLAASPQARMFSLQLAEQLVERNSSWLEGRQEVERSRSSRPVPDESPVFFVGFPRSGTTLLEQMLVAHPKIVSLDERPVLGECIRSMSTDLYPPKRYPEDLGKLSEAELQELRGRYWRRVQEHLGAALPPRVRLLDKMPLNIYSLPLVERMFSGASVLVMHRDPRDVCISCMMQDLRPNVVSVHFHTIESTARLYARTMQLLWKMQRRLNLRFIDVRYEDLIDDYQAVTRRVLSDLDLEWNEQISSYRESTMQRVVASPSYAAVREPISSRPRARWRRYQAWIMQAHDILDPLIRAQGYPSWDHSESSAPTNK